MLALCLELNVKFQRWSTKRNDSLREMHKAKGVETAHQQHISSHFLKDMGSQDKHDNTWSWPNTKGGR